MGLFSSSKPAPQQHTELAHTHSAPAADPEQPHTASSAPAGLLDGGPRDSSSTAQQQADQAGKQQPDKHHHLHVGRAKSDPTGDHSRKPQRDTLTTEQEKTLQHLQALTKVLDQAVTIPLLNRKIGLDALIGLVPYAGDMAGAATGTYIITRALKFHMPRRLVVRMLANQAIDSVVGIVPFIGDLFDIGFKANVRNMRLLEEHLQHPKQAKRADTCFLCGLFFLVVVLPMVLAVLIVAGIILGICAAFGKL